MAEYVRIFDTTLRDGEQSPGFALTSPQKVEMAHQLARLGVDVLEAGFPAASDEELAAVQRVAREVRGPIIAALSPPIFSRSPYQNTSTSGSQVRSPWFPDDSRDHDPAVREIGRSHLRCCTGALARSASGSRPVPTAPLPLGPCSL